MQLVNDEAFLEAFNRLNKTQQEAVEAIDGPVMVIAGPGTGKTQILTLRIANILRKTDSKPGNILALTFTKSGAIAMRDRLRRFIGTAAYQVPIFTFHGLAEKLIKDYPEAYERIIGGKPATEIEKITFIEKILEEDGLLILRPHGDPSFYVKPLLSIIGTMKQENINPVNLASIINKEEETLRSIPQYHEKGAHKGKERSEYTKAVSRLEKLKALLRVYQSYEALLRSEKRYDFDDMIIETVAVLRDREDIRLDLQETYHYILADEHQDVNGAQNEILNHLSSFHEKPNIFVVGDEKQAIYRFQGASLENFLYFVEHYSGTKIITLTDNYRSNQAILDQGHELVAVEETSPLAPYRVPLISHTESTNKPTCVCYGHEGLEDLAVIERVKNAISRGVPPTEIAVIVRSNREVETLTTMLRGDNVAVNPSADTDILKNPLFLTLMDLLEFIVRPHDEVLLTRVFMSPYWHIPLVDVMTIVGRVNYSQSLLRVLNELNYEDECLFNPDAVRHFNQTIQDLRSMIVTESPHRVIARLCTDSGLLMYASAHDPLLGTSVIRRLYDEVEALVVNNEVSTLFDVVVLLRQRIAYGVPLAAPLLRDGNNAVSVMTAHKSKGLEFEVVIVPHLTENRWGVNKKPDYFKVPLMRTVDEYDVLEDEKRLLYVALTRAKNELYLSYSNTNSEGKELVPSPLTDCFPLPEINNDDYQELKKIMSVHVNTDLRRVFVPAIEKTLLERGFSATSLNNCIKNPWHFLYRNVIRLPDVQNVSLQFGTVMHSVLEYATRTYSDSGALPDFNRLCNKLEAALSFEPLSNVEFTNLYARGQEVLAVYREHLVATLPHKTIEELSVRVMTSLKDSPLTDIPLTGKLDRLDMDTNGLAVRVVDYKTGKAKSRNEIEGKTAKADASYRRQLSFYALLLKLYGVENYNTTTGVLSFIEPDSKGRIHEESYDSDDEDQSLLLDTIAQSVGVLVSGDFLHDEALLAESDYAEFGRHLKDIYR